MKQIVVDLERTRVLECGLGQFSVELTRELIRQRREDEQLVLFLPPERADLFADESAAVLPVYRWCKSQYVGHVRRVANRLIPGRQYDLWHSTNQTSRYDPWNRNVPILLTIHDLNFLREKEERKIEAQLRVLQKKVDRAAGITAISKFVAGEITDHLDLRGKPVHVIYNGASSENGAGYARPSFVPPAPFLFSIGEFAAKKNFHVLVDMLQHLPNLRLVLAGRNSTEYGKFVQRSIQQHRLGDRIVAPGAVSNADRQWLYANCEAFLFPSLTEGFGLPVIEAMHAGKPVFLSRLTSLPEVGGRHAFYWPTFEPRAMAKRFQEGMQQVGTDPGYSARARAHAAQFSWKRAASEYLRIYRQVIDEWSHPFAARPHPATTAVPPRPLRRGA